MNDKCKVIAILGGMGHDATIDIQKKISHLWKEKKNITADQDYPQIIVDNDGRSCAILDDEKEHDKLREICKTKMENFASLGADIVIAPCNTFHKIYHDLQDNNSLPMPSIIEAVSNSVLNMGIKNIGLLGTTFTINNRLYHDILENKGVTVTTLSPEQNKDVRGAIQLIKVGNFYDKPTESFISDFFQANPCLKDECNFGNSAYDTIMQAISSLHDKGVSHVILGCTELPLIFDQMSSTYEVKMSFEHLDDQIDDKTVTLLDSTYILAESAVSAIL